LPFRSSGGNGRCNVPSAFGSRMAVIVLKAWKIPKDAGKKRR
jgi:hypothetical protein